MEHFGVQKYLRYYKLLSINYSNVSASSSSDLNLLWRRLYGDRHEIIFFSMIPQRNLPNRIICTLAWNQQLLNTNNSAKFTVLRPFQININVYSIFRMRSW